jgi:hypothetical protein
MPPNSLHLHDTGTLGSSFLDHLNSEAGRAGWTYGRYSTSAGKMWYEAKQGMVCRFYLQKEVVASIPRLLNI